MTTTTKKIHCELGWGLCNSAPIARWHTAYRSVWACEPCLQRHAAEAAEAERKAQAASATLAALVAGVTP